MIDKIKSLIDKLNTYGIPVPFIRDPKTGKGSVSLSFAFISFNVVLIGLIGKFGKVLDIDLTQAIYWFGACSALYFGRQFQANGSNKSITIEKDNEKNAQS